MKLKKEIVRLIAMLLVLAITTISVFADTNFDNEDGAEFGKGTNDNFWGVLIDDGGFIYTNDYGIRTEGLRISIYNSENDQKVFDTIDITGSPYISSVSTFRYFSDDGELIPKTSWLSSDYVSRIYNAIDSASIAKYGFVIRSKYHTGGYSCKYIPELSEITIISPNNTANFEAVKKALSSENFLRNICDLIGGDLKYDDFVDGKYKIAFEPVAYFRYGGYNWALSATEVGVYNKYILNTKTAEWSSQYSMRALMGPLTHSNLPRSAFLETKDLSVEVYSPTAADYYNGNSNYNTDSCIIRSMGIGVLTNNTAEPPESEPNKNECKTVYHTDTDVYPSFEFVNNGEEDILGSTAFSITNASDEYPKLGVSPISEQVLINVQGSQSGVSYSYAYRTDEVGMTYKTSGEIDVYVDNPSYEEDEDGMYVSPYKKLGCFEDGDYIPNSGASGKINYTIKTANGRIIDSGTVNNSCPVGETGMGWFSWHTPSYEQEVRITIKPENKDIKIIDEDGNECNSLTIKANVTKVTEKTPPDPKVTDTIPSWHKLQTENKVTSNISQYAPNEDTVTLEWYTWSYSSDWTQHCLYSMGSKYDTSKFTYVSPYFTPDYDNYNPYMGASTERGEYDKEYWGLDNGYFDKKGEWHSRYKKGAVLLSAGSWEKVTFSVTLDADISVKPSSRCYTSSYSVYDEQYTMKSGYGFEISVNCHLSGDTDLCTGSQTVNTLFPEFNYNTHSGTVYNRLLEQSGTEYVFKTNPYSTYSDRVHFTPIWYPDDEDYIVLAEVFDVWCPAGQLSIRLADSIAIDGNVYDDWHIAPVSP